MRVFFNLIFNLIFLEINFYCILITKKKKKKICVSENLRSTPKPSNIFLCLPHSHQLQGPVLSTRLLPASPTLPPCPLPRQHSLPGMLSLKLLWVINPVSAPSPPPQKSLLVSNWRSPHPGYFQVLPRCPPPTTLFHSCLPISSLAEMISLMDLFIASVWKSHEDGDNPGQCTIVF